MRTWAERLWGKEATVAYLLIAACLILFVLLGSRDIWTQEYRWADIVSGMFFRHDFLHPYLNEIDYYDKPLLSYWLIASIVFITGEISNWALRLPSAFAGLLSIWAIYRLGLQLKNKQLGLLAGWMLLTTFYFIFWARTSSADMLNMAGTLFAVTWYFEKKQAPTFFNYAIFFLILALTALCKGLVGIIIPLIAIFPDLLLNQTWKKHLNLKFVLAMLPASLVYIFPFWASAHWNVHSYNESGLYLVYRENFLRYFKPFDHQDPIYAYLIFLPVYLLPWAFFFFPAIFSLKTRWKKMNLSSQWLVWALFLLFVFFTLSGSRRNYYILPLVPFAILITADWILFASQEFNRRNQWAGRFAIIFFLVMFIQFNVVQPLFYAFGGSQYFAAQLKKQANKIKPWSNWNFVMLDTQSRLRFYLHLPPTVKNYMISSRQRSNQTEQSLLQVAPDLARHNGKTIFISRQRYAPLLKNLLPQYEMITTKATLGERLLNMKQDDSPVAFIPRSS